MPVDPVSKMTLQVFDHATVAKQLRTLRTRRQVKPVYEHAAKLGFRPQTGATNLQGTKRSYTASQPVKSGRQKVQKLDCSYQVQEMQKPGSRDKAAIVVITLRGDGGADTVDSEARLLIAPGGDIQKAKEFKVDRATLKVVATNSWWTRTKACMKAKCSSSCLQALVTCPTSSWLAYLGCFAVKCGGCYVKCALCGGCNCKWWCKWAVGCCKD